MRYAFVFSIVICSSLVQAQLKGEWSASLGPISPIYDTPKFEDGGSGAIGDKHMGYRLSTAYWMPLEMDSGKGSARILLGLDCAYRRVELAYHSGGLGGYSSEEMDLRYVTAELKIMPQWSVLKNQRLCAGFGVAFRALLWARKSGHQQDYLMGRGFTSSENDNVNARRDMPKAQLAVLADVSYFQPVNERLSVGFSACIARSLTAAIENAPWLHVTELSGTIGVRYSLGN